MASKCMVKIIFGAKSTVKLVSSYIHSEKKRSGNTQKKCLSKILEFLSHTSQIKDCHNA